MTDTQRSIEILEALVGFDTTSRNSNLPLIDWVEGYLGRCGVAYERIPDQAGVKANIWATIGPADKPGYILSGHSDVVPVDGQSWASDPFRLSRRDGRLYGRGATDMKGFVACCLAAVPDMTARRLERPIHLAISYDEEVGCIGVRDIIARIERSAVKPAGCFVGEPSLMQVIVAHKSKRSLRVTVHGHTAHSSLAPQGVNAVEYAARLIVKIRDISERLAAKGPRDPFLSRVRGGDHPHAARPTRRRRRRPDPPGRAGGGRGGRRGRLRPSAGRPAPVRTCPPPTAAR